MRPCPLVLSLVAWEKRPTLPWLHSPLSKPWRAIRSPLTLLLSRLIWGPAASPKAPGPSGAGLAGGSGSERPRCPGAAAFGGSAAGRATGARSSRRGALTPPGSAPVRPLCPGIFAVPRYIPCGPVRSPCPGAPPLGSGRPPRSAAAVPAVGGSAGPLRSAPLAGGCGSIPAPAGGGRRAAAAAQVGRTRRPPESGGGTQWRAASTGQRWRKVRSGSSGRGAGARRRRSGPGRWLRPAVWPPLTVCARAVPGRRRTDRGETLGCRTQAASWAQPAPAAPWAPAQPKTARPLQPQAGGQAGL